MKKQHEWDVMFETGPHQFQTLTVLADDKSDALSKAWAEISKHCRHALYADARRTNRPDESQTPQG